jgi:small nuclear ribonucleoprotein (snRNP)-like protein
MITSNNETQSGVIISGSDKMNMYLQNGEVSKIRFPSHFTEKRGYYDISNIMDKEVINLIRKNMENVLIGTDPEMNIISN